MTDLERRVLGAVLEFARANEELRDVLMGWDSTRRPSQIRAEASQHRATFAREQFGKVSDEYRLANEPEQAAS